MKTITFPRLGPYTDILADLFRNLGCRIVLPRQNNKKSLNKAIANSPEMQCLPFKYNIADYIDVLDRVNGDITLLQFKTSGRCRFHAYYVTQSLILKKIGYKFKGIYPIRGSIFTFFDINKLTGAGIIKVIKEIIRGYKKIKRLEDKLYYKKGKIKIGLIGEIYTILDERLNLNLIKKIQNMGCKVENSLTLSHFLLDRLKLKISLKRRNLRKRAQTLLKETLGGHGINSIENFINFSERGFDGIIFVRPLTCMPETFVETIINHLSDKYNMPILTLNLDESTGNTHVDNRLEAYIESLKLRK